MSGARFMIVRLDNGRALAGYSFDDLSEARDQLDDAAFDLMLDREVDDKSPLPDLAVEDLLTGDVAELVGDRPMWAWYDSFSGAWRGKLSTSDGAP